MHESKMRMVIEGHTVTILCKYNIKGGEARVTIHRLSLEKIQTLRYFFNRN